MSHLSLLSALELPWDHERNRQLPEHARSSEERAVRCGLINGQDEDEATRRLRDFIQLDGYVYPDASLERLAVAGGFNQWLYFLSQQYEHRPRSHVDLEAIRNVMQLGVDSLAGGTAPVEATPFTRYSRCYRRELLALMAPASFERLLRHLKSYLFEGALLWLGHWLRRETLSLDGYIELCALGSAMHPAVDCIELARGLNLSEDVLEGRELTKMLQATVRHVALVDDLASFASERHDGSTVNLIHVLRTRENRSVQSALQRAAELINDCVGSFCKLEQRLPQYEPRVQAELHAYVNGMKSWMRGNVDFSLHGQHLRSGISGLSELARAPDRSA